MIKSSENCKIIFIDTYSSIKLSYVLSPIIEHIMIEDVHFQLIYCDFLLSESMMDSRDPLASPLVVPQTTPLIIHF